MTSLLTTAQAASAAFTTPAVIRYWAHKGRITAVAYDDRGRPLYDAKQVTTYERDTRLAGIGRPRAEHRPPDLEALYHQGRTEHTAQPA